MFQKYLLFDYYRVTRTSSRQQLTFYFVLFDWSGVCVARGAALCERAAWKTNAAAFRRVFRALWTHLIQSEPLMLSTHRLGVHYLGVINRTCFITQRVVELVTHGWKKYLSKKKKKEKRKLSAAALSFHQASTLVLYCSWLLQLQPMNTNSQRKVWKLQKTATVGGKEKNNNRCQLMTSHTAITSLDTQRRHLSDIWLSKLYVCFFLGGSS